MSHMYIHTNSERHTHTRTHTVTHLQACGLPQGRSHLSKTEMTFHLLCIVSLCMRMHTRTSM